MMLDRVFQALRAPSIHHDRIFSLLNDHLAPLTMTVAQRLTGRDN